MSEEFSYSDVKLNVNENGKDLLNVTTGDSFFVAVFDDNNQECSGRMCSTEAGINFIQGAICCLLETMLRNELVPEDARDALHTLVDDVVNDYCCDLSPSELN